ncbi:MAG: tRNA (adenosine(37)-N6)-threonylcarbamoyltransferase complex ATPase subunit type 1 TsaE, partial [Solirubrobacteraceae bacterium]
MRRLTSTRPADTEALGAQLAAALNPGDVVLISGDLGSGKTTLVRGACDALGADGPITSPTFAIANRYRCRGGVVVSHLDLYRAVADDQALLEDYLGAGEITFIEWPEMLVAAVEACDVQVRARVVLEHAGGDR